MVPSGLELELSIDIIDGIIL